MIKTVIVFIWEKLIFLIYPLKLFSFLFNFLIEILKVFNDIFSKIIHFIKDSLPYLMFQNPLNVDEGFWERLKEIAKMIFAITVGGIVTYFFKEVQNFLLNSFIKISDLLFKIVLRILDIILILSKLFYFIFKNVIIMLSFVFSIYNIFLFYYCENETKKLYKEIEKI